MAFGAAVHSSGLYSQAERLLHFAALQLRVELHEEFEWEEIAMAVSAGWSSAVPNLRCPPLILAYLLWIHDALDRWDLSEASAAAAIMAFVHVCMALQPAHALHFLDSLSRESPPMCCYGFRHSLSTCLHWAWLMEGQRLASVSR